MTGDDEPQPTKGTAFGCLTAFVVFTCVSFVLFFAVAWGGAHCEPVPSCQHENERRFLLEMLFLLLFVAVLGFLVRQLASHIFRQMAGRSTVGAAVINLLLALLIAWLGVEAAMRLLLLF
jgi:magnesium-transporting ATPase (P-type)